MIIVVEGPDNAGKTTLALSLAKKMKAIYLKSENIPPKPEFLMQYVALLAAAQLYGNGIVISDRHHAISEPIYGPIVRSGSAVDVKLAEGVLMMIDAIVYCRPANEAILKSMQVREQMHGVAQNAHRIIDAYDKFFSRHTDRTFRYDYQRDSEQALIQEIHRFT